MNFPITILNQKDIDSFIELLVEEGILKIEVEMANGAVNAFLMCDGFPILSWIGDLKLEEVE